MQEFPIRTAEQLTPILAGFRKTAGLTQADLAVLMGVSQQTYSAAERNAQKMSVDRLLTLLNALGVDLVLKPKTPNAEAASSGAMPLGW